MVITTAKKKAIKLKVFSCKVEYHYLVTSKDLMTDLDYQILYSICVSNYIKNGYTLFFFASVPIVYV